jgi:hypothetical protein
VGELILVATGVLVMDTSGVSSSDADGSVIGGRSVSDPFVGSVSVEEQEIRRPVRRDNIIKRRIVICR